MSAGPEQPVVWSSRAEAPWALLMATGFLGLGLLLLAVAAVAVELVLAASAVTCFVVGLIGLLFTRAEVSVGSAGLTVALGAFGRPRLAFAPERISGAAADTVRPLHWGGWGYRGSLRLFRRAAVVLRAGEALRVDLERGRRFWVTVDDAEAGAAALNRLIGRQD